MAGVLEVEILDAAGGQVPVKANATDAGFDLFASKRVPEFVIGPWEHKKVDTDIAIAVPPGTYGRVAPRSGLALKSGIHVGAGVVDEGYRGNLGIVLFNLSDEPFTVKPGDRVAQLILEKIADDVSIKMVPKLTASARGAGGFGSSGTAAFAMEEKKGEKRKVESEVDAAPAVKRQKIGKIVQLRGPMFASKTTNLRAFARRYSLAKKNCLIVKYSKDTRYSKDSELITHDMVRIQASCMVERLADIQPDVLGEADVVLIDEAHFYEDLVEFCTRVAQQGKIVVAAGLVSTWDQRPFVGMCHLTAHADEIITLKAVCTLCGEDAIYTKRIVPSNKLQLIGGANLYAARCRTCHNLP